MLKGESRKRGGRGENSLCLQDLFCHIFLQGGEELLNMIQRKNLAFFTGNFNATLIKKSITFVSQFINGWVHI